LKKSKTIVCLMLTTLVAGLFASVSVYGAHGHICARISLTKTPSATRVLNGTTVSYLYNATNTGYTALTGAIYDNEFGDVGYFVDLAPGGWVGFNVSHVLTHSTYNVATAYGVDQYGHNVTSTDSAYVRVRNPCAAISLTKTPSATRVLNGTAVSYLYNATNTGDTALTGAIYDDEFGAVGYFVDLAPGGWVGFNVTHVLTHSTYNVATAYGVDQYGSNVTSTACAYVRVRNPCAAISLTKTPSATKVLVGSSVSYLYNVTNTGDTALTGAIYDDEFGLVGNFVNLQPGGWVAFNVTHVLTHSTYNVATAYGIDQYGQKVTSAASAYVRVYSSWDYCRWWYYYHRMR
jgi:glyoxylate utilization-related uncharacterized protein